MKTQRFKHNVILVIIVMLIQGLYENEELWTAMKDSKYRKLLADAKEKFSFFNGNEDVFLEVLNSTVDSIHAEAGTLWIYDRKKTGKIFAKSVYGGKNLSNISLKPGEGVAGNAIATNMPVLITDCQKDSRWAGKVDKDTGFTTKTMICVPLAVKNECFGCIQIINKVDGTLFDDKDYNFTIALGKEISILFENNKQKLLSFFYDEDLINTLYTFTKDVDFEKLKQEIKDGEHFANVSALKKANVIKNIKAIYDFLDKNY